MLCAREFSKKLKNSVSSLVHSTHPFPFHRPYHHFSVFVSRVMSNLRQAQVEGGVAWCLLSISGAVVWVLLREGGSGETSSFRTGNLDPFRTGLFEPHNTLYNFSFSVLRIVPLRVGLVPRPP